MGRVADKYRQFDGELWVRAAAYDEAKASAVNQKTKAQHARRAQQDMGGQLLLYKEAVGLLDRLLRSWADGPPPHRVTWSPDFAEAQQLLSRIRGEG